jgi:hypothetical protein
MAFRGLSGERYANPISSNKNNGIFIYDLLFLYFALLKANS